MRSRASGRISATSWRNISLWWACWLRLSVPAKYSIFSWVLLVEKAKILGYEIRCEHLHQHINLNVVLSDNKLNFTFDEIVRNQGFVIDIIHTGRNKDLFFSANFKNAKIKRKFICHKLHKSLLDKIPCSILWTSWLLVVTIAALSNIITESLSIKSIVYGIISFSLTLIGLLTHFRENYAPYWGVPLNLQASIKEFDK